MGVCRICGVKVEDFEIVCESCAQRNSSWEEEEYENELKEKGFL